MKVRRRIAIWFAFAYFLAMTVGVTFPAVGFVNTARPFVFGVPFVFVWYLVWVAGALFVFLLLYRSTP